jgi:hypothetical protein
VYIKSSNVLYGTELLCWIRPRKVGGGGSGSGHNSSSKYLSIMVWLLGEFNNTAFSHDLTPRQGFASYLSVYTSVVLINIFLIMCRAFRGVLYEKGISATSSFEKNPSETWNLTHDCQCLVQARNKINKLDDYDILFGLTQKPNDNNVGELCSDRRGHHPPVNKTSEDSVNAVHVHISSFPLYAVSQPKQALPSSRTEHQTNVHSL